ncbi:DUF5906 domain-containing protein [Variovorax sp. J2P1-59]|uniref:primase-helicase family protein n=1 Tax=Variovorax flavidus TaxID=3053501 RepID=UPI002576D5C2|nr:primase-helicase family protein [Variovorax sp. J2P1-59]MDM0074420.1 DUF5906 domain-containing protein [Variovorax sp. J2P1-59]
MSTRDDTEVYESIADLPEDERAQEIENAAKALEQPVNEVRAGVDSILALRKADRANTADIQAIEEALSKTVDGDTGALFTEYVLEQFRLLIGDSETHARIWARVKSETKSLTALKAAAKNHAKQWAKEHKRSELKVKKPAGPGIGRLNKEFATVVYGGKSRISVKSKKGYEFWLPDAFHAYLAGDVVPVEQGGTVKMAPLSHVWASHPERNRFRGVEFSPTKKGSTSGGVLNLWSGWAVEPIEKCTFHQARSGCRRLLIHIWENVCQRNRAQFKYLIRWCAHMVQKPEDKPGVAVSISGKQGVGKSTLSVALQSLLGNHAVKLAQGSQLLGKFNEHLGYSLLAASEEAFWAGDPQAEGALQDLITSDTLTIEPKGLGLLFIRSYLRLISTSNKTWNFPASKDVRRLFALICGDAKMQNTDYFKAIGDQLYGEGKKMHEPGQESLGLRHFFTYLTMINLAGFNVRKPPETEGLKQQRLGSLKPEAQFIYECLMIGELPINDGLVSVDRQTLTWTEDGATANKGDLHRGFVAWCNTNRKRPVAINDFTKFIRETLGWGEDKPEGKPRRWLVTAWSESRSSFERVMKVRVEEAEGEATDRAPPHIEREEFPDDAAAKKSQGL